MILASLIAATVVAPASAARPTCGGKVATIVGSQRGETIRGTAKADVIVAKGGKDTVYGRGGKDVICGGAGSDILEGGGGTDILKGGDGADTLKGGAGTDTCRGGPGPDRLFSCNEPATTGTLTITTDTTLAAPHKGDIVIGADGVRLDCDGHVITGPGSGTGIKVFGRQDVVIVGCHATNFDHGFYVVGSSGVAIRSSSATHNDQGFAVEDSVASLTNNVANGNTSWGFILMQEMTGTKLVGNRADNNTKHGFALSSSTGAWLESNVARWNRQSNIDLYQSEGNTLRSNSTKGRSIGFHLGESTDNVLKGNVARGHQAGFHTYDSAGNLFRGNTARNNGVGIKDGTSGGSGTKGTDNTYVNNMCIANGTKSDPKGLC